MNKWNNNNSPPMTGRRDVGDALAGDGASSDDPELGVSGICRSASESLLRKRSLTLALPINLSSVLQLKVSGPATANPTRLRR